MEGGKIGRLTEIVLFKLIEILDTVGVNRVGLALLDHFAGEIFVRCFRIRTERLGGTVNIGIGQRVIPGDRRTEVGSVLVDALNQDRTAGAVILDTNGLADPIPGELPDLILDGFLSDLHDSGIQKILDVGGLENLVEGIEIA